MTTSTSLSKNSPFAASTPVAADPLDFCMEWNAENQLTRPILRRIARNAAEHHVDHRASARPDSKAQRPEVGAGPSR